MGVPVVSSNVGGQAELIYDNVGAVVPCIQDEEDILNYNYSDEEINNYVHAINKVLSNLDFYKGNSRKTVLDKFTIGKMIEKMDDIFNSIILNNKQSVNIEYSIEKFKDIFKEIITRHYMLHSEEYEWLCKELNIKLFGREIIETENESNLDNSHEFRKKLIRFTVKLHIYKESKIIYKILVRIKEIISLIIQFFIQIFKHIFRIGG